MEKQGASFVGEWEGIGARAHLCELTRCMSIPRVCTHQLLGRMGLILLHHQVWVPAEIFSFDEAVPAPCDARTVRGESGCGVRKSLGCNLCDWYPNKAEQSPRRPTPVLQRRLPSRDGGLRSAPAVGGRGRGGDAATIRAAGRRANARPRRHRQGAAGGAAEASGRHQQQDPAAAAAMTVYTNARSDT